MYKYSACGFSVLSSTTHPYAKIHKRFYVYHNDIITLSEKYIRGPKSLHVVPRVMTFQSKPLKVKMKM